MNRTAVPRVCH